MRLRGGMNPRGILLRKWSIDTPLLKIAARQAGSGVQQADARPPMPLRTLGGSRRAVRPCDVQPDWPATTDTWCWYCCHPFDGPPLPMPIKYDDRRDIFHVSGTFCSWPCMKKYNGESTSYLKAVNATTITLFHKRCTGVLASIKPAPPRIALRVFGGSMSIDEFRAASAGNTTLHTLPARMIMHHASLEETTSKPRGKVQDMKETICFKDVSARNETLRLKRPKPLQNNRNTLERTLGINAMMVCAAPATGDVPPPPPSKKTKT